DRGSGRAPHATAGPGAAGQLPVLRRGKAVSRPGAVRRTLFALRSGLHPIQRRRWSRGVPDPDRGRRADGRRPAARRRGRAALVGAPHMAAGRAPANARRTAARQGLAARCRVPQPRAGRTARPV
ncbi:MAG: Uncharacterized protein DUF983 associated with cytochrome c oxidase?, partial [uncultured Sphingomonas sp.]